MKKLRDKTNCNGIFVDKTSKRKPDSEPISDGGVTDVAPHSSSCVYNYKKIPPK